MKIKRLDLKAYGHFTDCTIDFASDSPGLHIIYGPNEAGKSTTLRALRGLLYGIPMRTPDNFLHDYSKLKIGGHLENSDGKTLVFWRRKKNTGDLLNADDTLIEQDVLAEFLHGIEEPLFSALFAIDHETLVSGGRDILEQKGDIGQALFSAGAGLSSLHGVIERMEQECENLFKSGGSRPEINQAIRVYQDIKKEIRQLSLSSTAWKEQNDLFDAASRDLVQIEEKKTSLGVELERLRRLQRAIPNLVRRSTLKESLGALGDFSHLPQDFCEQLQDALGARKQIAKVLQDASSRQQDLQKKKEGTSFRQDVLDQSETIDDLHQRLGVQRQAAQDRPRINTDLIECRTEAATLLNQVAPSLDLAQTEKIKELLDRRTSILPLGNRFAGLDTALSQAKTRTNTLNDELTKIESQLESLDDVGDLRSLNAAVLAAQKAGDLDGGLRTLDRDISLRQANAETGLKRMGLWNGSHTELLALPLPSTVTLDAFVEKYRESNEALGKNKQDQREVQGELDRVSRDIDAIEKTGSVVTENLLIQARDQRDYGWQLIKRSWLNGETLETEICEYAESKDLPGAFERRLHEADEVSDQLRASADRVHQYASLRAERDKLEKQHRRLEEEAGHLTVQMAQGEQEWLTAWKGSQITPLSPKEMRGWLDQCQNVVRTLEESQQKQLEKQPLIEQRKQLVTALAAELTRLGQGKSFASAELSAALVYAEQIYAELKAIHERRNALLEDKRRNIKDLSHAADALQKAQTAMASWRQQWTFVLDGFGLPHDATVDEAANALDTLRICLDKSVEISGLERRLADIDQHALQFDTSVKALVRSVAPELALLPSDQAVAKLQAVVKEAEKAKSVLEKIEEDLAAVSEELRQARVSQQVTEDALVSLRALAGCDDEDSLLRIETSFQDYQAKHGEMSSVEQALLGIAEGVALDELEAQRQMVDPNQLPGQVAELTRQIQGELEPQIKLLSEKKGGAQSALQRMDGGADAAALEEKAQAALAKVRRLADRYLRVRLGSQLLKKEIERYRQENQDPILKAASRYFSDLTLGSFSGLRSDLDGQGNPILVGVCPDERTRTVEEMSSGTRDQLYLALRLATLEWRLEKHEPMPFVADDILVNFDDERSTATLKALAGLARKNQVLLLTHHQQIVETVESLGLPGHVVVHRLEGLAGYESSAPILPM